MAAFHVPLLNTEEGHAKLQEAKVIVGRTQSAGRGQTAYRILLGIRGTNDPGVSRASQGNAEHGTPAERTKEGEDCSDSQSR